MTSRNKEKFEKVTRVHRHLIDPLTGEIIRQDDPKYQIIIDQYNQSKLKHETSGGFLPDSLYSQYDNETKKITNGLKSFDINDNNHDMYSNRQILVQQNLNGNAYNEPENN
ncbi:unnamed protein product, partial [Rotaria sp. Silwood2]